MTEIVVRATLTIVFGSIAGGVTNSLAIWMLFHPYEPPRLLGRRLRSLQGAIPKNKVRLAGAIGRAVGTRLLAPEDLARIVSEPEFREAFDERLGRFIAAVLDRERGPLSEILPAPLLAELRALLDEAVDRLLERLDEHLASDEFRDRARRWAEAFADEIADQPLGEVLTREREATLAAAVDRWIAEAVEGQGFERVVSDALDRAARRILVPGRTFQELLPPGLVAALERAIAGYLPLALERLAALLEDPAARERVQLVLREVLDRFMRDLKFHKRLVASLLITPDTIDKVLQAVEAEGAGKISEALDDPAVRDAMARGVNDAIVDFLGRSVTDVLGSPGDPSIEDAKGTVAGWILRFARDEQTRTFLVDKLQATLRLAERRTFGDVLRHLPPDRLADALVAAARSERTRALYRDAANRLAARALDVPLGRLADHIPTDAAARLEAALAEPLWGWLQEEAPDIARRIDVGRQVEKKILEFPMEKVEELIREVTERELRIIVRLGYVLGGVIGTISAAIGILVG